MRQETVKISRNIGIDLLRIVSMLFVVFIHVLGRGGILDAATPLSANYEIAWFMNVTAYCAVNCYALISGYVGIHGKFRCSNLGILWLRVFFYTIIITILFGIGMKGSVGKREILNAFFPVSTEQYWYFTAYVGLFFFIPMLNYFIIHASKRQLKMTVLICVLLFSFIPTIFRSDVFDMLSGFSPFWLMVLYLIGGYIGQYGVWRKKSLPKLGLIYLLCIVLTWGAKFCIEYGRAHFLGGYKPTYFLVSYDSPTILLAGIVLVLIFSRLKIGQRMGKIIIFIAPTAFSVYLIHFHPLVKELILQDRFSGLTSMKPWQMIITFILTVIVIYVVCTLIDLVREALFKKLNVKNKLVQLERKVVDRMKVK